MSDSRSLARPKTNANLHRLAGANFRVANQLAKRRRQPIASRRTSRPRATPRAGQQCARPAQRLDRASQPAAAAAAAANHLLWAPPRGPKLFHQTGAQQTVALARRRPHWLPRSPAKVGPEQAPCVQAAGRGAEQEAPNRWPRVEGAAAAAAAAAGHCWLGPNRAGRWLGASARLRNKMARAEAEL